jgi:hypothetical protein
LIDLKMVLLLTALKKLDCRIAILGFPRARVTHPIAIVIDWFTPVSHATYADIMIGDLDKKL